MSGKKYVWVTEKEKGAADEFVFCFCCIHVWPFMDHLNIRAGNWKMVKQIHFLRLKRFGEQRMCAWPFLGKKWPWIN
jgi:hypothetical protein